MILNLSYVSIWSSNFYLCVKMVFVVKWWIKNVDVPYSFIKIIKNVDMEYQLKKKKRKKKTIGSFFFFFLLSKSFFTNHKLNHKSQTKFTTFTFQAKCHSRIEYGWPKAKSQKIRSEDA